MVYSSFSENNARFPRYRESRYVVAELLIVALFQAPGGSRLCLVFVRCYTGVTMSYYPHTIVFLLAIFQACDPIHYSLQWTFYLRSLLTSVGVLSRLPAHDPACPQCHAYLQTVQRLVQDIAHHNQQNNKKVDSRTIFLIFKASR